MHNTLDTINQRVHYLQANNTKLISQTLVPMTSSSDQHSNRSRTYTHSFFLCSFPAAIPWHPPLLIPPAAFAARPPPHPVAAATHYCTETHSLSHLPTQPLLRRLPRPNIPSTRLPRPQFVLPVHLLPQRRDLTALCLARVQTNFYISTLAIEYRCTDPSTDDNLCDVFRELWLLRYPETGSEADGM